MKEAWQDGRVDIKIDIKLQAFFLNFGPAMGEVRLDFDRAKELAEWLSSAVMQFGENKETLKEIQSLITDSLQKDLSLVSDLYAFVMQLPDGEKILNYPSPSGTEELPMIFDSMEIVNRVIPMLDQAVLLEYKYRIKHYVFNDTLPIGGANLKP